MAALLEPPLPLDSILPTLAGGKATGATVLRAQAVGRLSEAIEKLPERLRLVLSLHYNDNRQLERESLLSHRASCRLNPFSCPTTASHPRDPRSSFHEVSPCRPTHQTTPSPA
jgi:hypothetical protein